MTRREAQDLINKYAEGTCTPEEKTHVERWYQHELSSQKLPADPDEHSSAKSEMWDSIRDINGLDEPDIRSRKTISRIAIAAVLVFILSTSTYFYRYHKKHVLSSLPKAEQKLKDVDPGVDKAILTLADGSKIFLDNTGKGLIATQPGIKINKLSDGSLIYEVSVRDNNTNTQVSYNTIETPKGAKYQIILQDGSKVWLNAASSLRFPATFNGNERSVQLSGEAFFEIAKNKALPFKVKTKDLTVYVTGTQFNVMAYNDEIFSAATLIEGSVDVTNNSDELALVPGEQVVKRSGIPLSKKAIDIEQAIAWKNGLFQFADSDIQSVMRQIGRWYDVSVEYRGKIPANRFGGYISRDSKLSQVIKMLELSGVRFAIEDKKIIVLP